MPLGPGIMGGQYVFSSRFYFVSLMFMDSEDVGAGLLNRRVEIVIAFKNMPSSRILEVQDQGLLHRRVEIVIAFKNMPRSRILGVKDH